MLTPDELREFPRPLENLFRELEEFTIADISRRVAKTGGLTETAEFQLERAKELGISNRAIAQKIASLTEKSESEAADLLREAAEKADFADREKLLAETVPFEENLFLQQLLQAEIPRIQSELRNVTGSLGFVDNNGKNVALTEMYNRQADLAHLKIATGVSDYNSAIRDAVKTLSQSGLQYINWQSGHHDRADVAVRRAVMTSVGQVTQRISEQNGAKFGSNGWEISAHPGARPSHAVYQGRQFPQSDYETIVKPLVEDYNCRHSAFPIIIGISKPNYTAAELAKIDPPPFVWNGQRFTAYEATQKQRSMERSMRKTKREMVASDAAGLQENFTVNAIKLSRQRQIYVDFSKSAGLYEQFERAQVAEFGRSFGARAGAVTRKINKLTKEENNVKIKITDFDPKRLQKHLDKHLKEFGDITPEEYVKRAKALLNSDVGGNI
jgi:hypothetical protein